MKAVIIGGGVAAAEAAIAIRKNDPASEVVLCTAENSYPYRRPFLSKGLLKGFAGEGFLLKSAEFYQREQIDVRLNTVIEKIDPGRKEVLCNDGSVLSYDKLLLATGARARNLPVPGADLPHVRTLRDLKDAEAIRKQLAEGVPHAMIIGGGILGLELAEVLLEAKCGKVTVVECAPALLPRNLDAASSAQILEHLKNIPGLELRFNERITEITPETADLVIISAGVIPETELASAAGICCANGILVNPDLQTSEPDIYAAGDCAELPGCVSGIYTTASDMGKAAGNNMSGDGIVFKPLPASMRFMGFGLKLFSCGDFSGEMEEFQENGNVKRLFRKDGKLSGAVLIGDMRESMKLFNEINN